MNDRNSPSPSFNTVKRSNRKRRQERIRRERLTVLSICAVVILLLLTLAVFLFCLMADPPSHGENPDGGDTPDAGNPPTSVIYTTVSKLRQDLHVGELILVNENHAYVFPEVDTGLLNIYENRDSVDGVTPYQVSYNTWKLRSSAFAALESMMQKYYAVSDDNSTLVTSAYRSYEDQVNLGSSIPAGYSDHHTGYCAALQRMNLLTGGREKLESSHWIYQNCHKYGYIVRYPASKSLETGVSDYDYCFRYVGIPHATYITQNGLCLEEYVELLKTNYASGAHLSIKGADGNDYEVYYVAASSSELTSIKIPQNYQYTISGDNVGGFIVTIHLDEPAA